MIAKQVEEGGSMLRKISGPTATAALLLSATATFAAPVQGKRDVIYVAGTAAAFCPATVHPNGSNRSGGHKIGGQPIGMAAPAFTEDVGPAMASADGHRRRSAMSGIAVDRRPRPSPATIASRILPQSNGLNDKC
jgi:hypothetical protein